jgi:anti-anti-sigma factor
MSQQPATIQVEHVDDVVVINVSGDFSHQPSSSVEDAVKGVLNDGARRIVVDLSQTTRMNSEAIGDFVQAFVQARDREAEFVVVFKLTGLLPGASGIAPYEIYDSRAEALDALRRPTGDKQSRSGSRWSNWLTRWRG